MSSAVHAENGTPAPTIAPALMALIALAAACAPVPDLPPLPTDPTEAQIKPHVARYCVRAQTCAPEANVGADCAAKLLEKAETPEGRRGLAIMMNLFGPCMTMDCMSMSVCFAGKSAKMAKEAIENRPPSIPSPRKP